jgi:hypothetical protein
VQEGSHLYMMLEREKRNEIKLNMSMGIGMNMGSTRAANIMDTNVFTYKDIGQTIQKLVSNFYQHKFTKLPFERISNDQAIKILKDTVNKPLDIILFRFILY